MRAYAMRGTWILELGTPEVWMLKLFYEIEKLA